MQTQFPSLNFIFIYFLAKSSQKQPVNTSKKPTKNGKRNRYAPMCEHTPFSHSTSVTARKSMLENFRSLVSTQPLCISLLFEEVFFFSSPSLLSQTLTKTVHRISSTDGSLSSQFKRTVPLSQRKTASLVQKPPLISLSTVFASRLRVSALVSSAVVPSLTNRGNYGEPAFSAPPKCHTVQSWLSVSFFGTESSPQALYAV